MLVGNIIAGRGSRARSTCCILEQDQVSAPGPVVQEEILSPRLSSDYEVQSEYIVDYVDTSETVTSGCYSGNAALSTYDATSDTAIADFLKRPVRINSYTWLESDVASVKQTIYPWQLWATNAAVVSKLNNYAFLRGDLHIRVVINASPFYFGLTKLSYLPLPSFKPSTIVNDASTRYFIPMSQRPSIDIDPYKEQTIEMVLPFIYPKNVVPINLSANFQDMGLLNYVIYVPLQSANGVTGTGITVTTYAWMENITLSGATVGFAAQSETLDEYGEGCVSKPASNVAKVASYLENVPIIGVFAKATRIGASAVSSIASLFGFTNVPVIKDAHPVRYQPFPQLASTEIGYPIEKLTIDPKNELSIDPRIVGLDGGEDEMTINSVVTRQSYLTGATWSTAGLADDVLFYARVNPRMYDNDNGTNNKVYMTPMCYISNMFNNWRGDIIFTFKIVCSKYHKGRLRISYDPHGDSTRHIGNITDSVNMVHTAIVDISEQREVEMRIPYQQATAFLGIRPSLAAADKGWAENPGSTPLVYDSNYDNGTLMVRILNTLTAPVASSSIRILVYVKGASNLEFGNPANVFNGHNMSFFAPQSEKLSTEIDPKDVSLGIVKQTAENLYSVHFGENVRSLRQLLRRFEYHSCNDYLPTAVTPRSMVFYIKKMYRMPTSPGFLSTGTETANKIVGVGTYNYNFAQMTNISYLSNAYLCYRGSINWTMIAIGGATTMCFRISRDNVNGSPAGMTITSSSMVSKNTAASSLMNASYSASSGQSCANGLVNPTLSIQLPNYSIFKFQSTNPDNANQGVTGDGSIYDQYTFEVRQAVGTGGTSGGIAMENYVGIGTDFGLYFFLNVPTVYLYSTVPTPA